MDTKPTAADLTRLRRDYLQGHVDADDTALRLHVMMYTEPHIQQILTMWDHTTPADQGEPTLWRLLQASNERCHNLAERNPLFASIRSLGSHVDEFLQDIGELAETLLPYLLHEPDIPTDQDLEAIATECCVALYDVIPDFEAGLKDAIVTLILLRDFISPAPMGQKATEQCSANGAEQEWTLSSDGQTHEDTCGRSGGVADVTKCEPSSLGDFIDPPYDEPYCDDVEHFGPDDCEPPGPLYDRFGGASLWTNFNHR